MGLAQLVYVSRREPWLTLEALRRVVASSARNNYGRDITGVLIVNGQNLMQLLEGEEADIEALFARIRSDPRHTNIERLLFKPVAKRLFPEWGMELADVHTRGIIDTPRLRRMIDDLRAQNQTGNLSVEARMLLSDFRQQLAAAA